MAERLGFATWLGLSFLALAGVIVLVWVPLDTDTGLVETVRRRLVVGDALAPTLAGVIIGLGGVLTALRPGSQATPDRDNLRYAIGLLVVFAVGLGLMRWTGPALAALLSEADYRVLRDTAPWKYTGFLTGGTVLVGTLIAFGEGRLRPRSFVIAAIACLAMILVYDLPFEDLLLPPNGDV